MFRKGPQNGTSRFFPSLDVSVAALPISSCFVASSFSIYSPHVMGGICNTKITAECSQYPHKKKKKKKQGTTCAIKRVNDVFEHRSLAKRTLRELKFIRMFKHENIMGCTRVMRPHTKVRSTRRRSFFFVLFDVLWPVFFFSFFSWCLFGWLFVRFYSILAFEEFYRILLFGAYLEVLMCFPVCVCMCVCACP